MTAGDRTLSAKLPNELTIRGLILGALICVVFTAANVYFGLRAGLTFATSIPATVISMAALRQFRSATIQENNIVQTVASAAGTLSAIIFVLPGLVMIGWWSGFPFWASFGVCAIGGILGVMYSIPLRRALVVNSDLPFPEGVACAEVLKVGSGPKEATGADAAEGKAGLLTVMVGSVASAGFAVVIATRLFAANIAHYFRAGPAATGFDLGLSLALLAVGHLVGLWVGVAMLVGLAISWAAAVPILTAMAGTAGPAADVAQAAWAHDVRFIGAGTIGVASIWTLIKLAAPVLSGLRGAMAAQAARKGGSGAALPLTEQDMPIGLVALISLVSLVPIGWLLADFAMRGGLGGVTLPLVGVGIVYIVIMGLFVSAVTGYMAGLIGASNSPLSGVGILAVLGAALLLVVGVKAAAGPDAGKALVAYALFVTSLIFAVGTIANNNLQDLKTGQLVDATPWKQQAALIIGVLMGAAVIPPVLDLLNHAYGFAGAPGVDPARALPAPQATLISSLAKGVVQGDLDWRLIGIGAGLGAVIIAIDAALTAAKRPGLPPLAVGLGIYLPMATTLMIAIGAVVGFAYERRADARPNGEAAKRLGVLLASGLIVGESLIGVILAAVVVGSGKPTPLAVVGDAFVPASMALGLIAFIALTFGLYRWVGRLART
ncbi:MAG TPA: oligopeptide transporter, OPT family [Caulobacteraceae bacterium]|jgi:putative OPT family oligopeptide transporter